MGRTLFSACSRGSVLVASAGAIVLALALVAAGMAGCGTAPAVEYSDSPTQPIISYQRTQALPPEFSPRGPVFIVYGDGTAYRREGLMDYKGGKLTDEQLKALVTSVVDKGFFGMEQLMGDPLPGGAVDHVTVTLKGRSSSVEAPEGTTGEFGAIVEELRSYKIPDEKEYLPDTITLFATENPQGQAVQGNVLEWTADPTLLSRASEARNSPTAGISVHGQEAQQAWKLLRDASKTGQAVAWSAGGRVYVSVYADPFFPAPGV